jgi:hypothetical protein
MRGVSDAQRESGATELLVRNSPGCKSVLTECQGIVLCGQRVQKRGQE